MTRELPADKLRKSFDAKELGITSTRDIKPAEGIIGQDRAVSSLKFGLDINNDGFNVYLSGPPGIGKMSAVVPFVKKLAAKRKTSPDWCYLNNFKDPYQPIACKFPPGKGKEFVNDMKHCIDHVKEELPRIFESDEYSQKKEEVISGIKKRQESLSKSFNQEASDMGFSIQATSLGMLILPVKDGKPLKNEELQQLPKKEQNEINDKRNQLQEKFNQIGEELRKLEREKQNKLKELDRKVALHVVEGMLNDISEKYQDNKTVSEYLKDVQEDIVDSIDAFKTEKSSDQNFSPKIAAQVQYAKEMLFRKYKVNILVDNSKRKGAPVVVELNPSYNNLFGRIEKEMTMGALNTDFTMIRPGAIHKANGGYLILPIEDVLKNILSWESLKRTLRSHQIQIEEPGEKLGFLSTKSLRPQPIPLDLKIVLVGKSLYYQLLHMYDEDFPELFKVKADFDTSMSITDKRVKDFLSFLAKFCDKENLLCMNSDAVIRVMEHALRLTSDQEKLSTHFGAIADVIRESNYWARKNNSNQITKKHIDKAIEHKIYRSNLMEEKVREMIDRDFILIDTKGKKIGQVNGLSVLSLGDYMFGKPSRITANVAPGKDGIIDIEREVKLGGPIHSKGVLILSGYLSHKFAQNRPLALSAHLVFEQSYSGIEGDSASSTELYALLSALSGLPIRQDIAVTGSVNQNGEVQAIGGVNEKIEGFYQVCKAKGLNGKQGVIIPYSNQKNLMLKQEVVDKVKQGKFHIWPVTNIEEGIELLTGTKAGKPDKKGNYPEKSVNWYVQNRLESFTQEIKKLSSAQEGKK